MIRLFRGLTGFVKRAQAQISKQGMGALTSYNREFKQATFLSHGQNPKVNLKLYARTYRQIFKLIVSARSSEKILHNIYR